MQRWWLLGVAVLGVGVAILLIPRPDTGADIEPAKPVAPVGVEAGQEPAPRDGAPRVRPSPDQMRPGPPPGAEKALAERNSPEAMAAKELATPWGIIRYKLNKEGSDEAKAMGAKIAPVQASFSRHIRTPEGELDALIATAAPLVDELKASPFVSDADIQKAIERYDAAVLSWKTAEKTE
jgi:hypothetical protein